MHHFLTAASLFLSLEPLMVRAAAVLPRQNLPFPNEVIYLSNCENNGVQSSELDYYSDFSTARSGAVAPDENNVSLVNPLHFANWIGLPGRAPSFFTSGVLFFLDSLSNAQIGQQAGAGHNNDGTKFTCFQESNQQLFTSGSKTCYAQWSCSHFNTVQFHTTKPSIGIIPTTVLVQETEDPNFASNVFGNVNQAIQNGGGGSCDGSFPFGDDGSFSITFTCSGDSQVLADLAKAFTTPQLFAASVNVTSTPGKQPTCIDDCLRPNGPKPGCCDTVLPTTSYVFPTHGELVNDLVDSANSNAGSTPQASISYEITGPQDSKGGCDSNLCQFFQGTFESGLGAITEELDAEIATVGILLGVVCLACGESG